MPSITIIGAGPSGLFAAERLATAGHRVEIFDQMPSPARKFLLAGRGGLNITHSEPLPRFETRYAEAAPWIAPALAAFPPHALAAWCETLGQPTFTGSSGRIFPRAMKAAPLLRAWLHRLATLGVTLATRHRWTGWDPQGRLVFDTPRGPITSTPDASLLALGGASWPRMGSDGHWTEILHARGIPTTPLRPANCGAHIAWSPIFRQRFEGTPLKRIALHMDGHTSTGDATITRHGLEGGALYPLTPAIRAALDAAPHATLHLDLRPDLTPAQLAHALATDRRGRSLPNFLRQTANLSPVAIGLIQEALHAGATDPLATLVKALPLPVHALPDIARAISSAGGLLRDALDPTLMLHALPGVFAAGEMIDWEAPTGGYLLQGCFSTGAWAAGGIAGYLESKQGLLF